MVYLAPRMPVTPTIRSLRILPFWAPLAATWLMMAIEGPFLAAVIARLADPKHNLAAFGVAFAVAILVEAPVIQVLSAATALVEGPRSFLKLRNFVYALNGLITAAMLALLATPAWAVVSRSWIGLPEQVAALTAGALWILLPWPAVIGYRRFYQGLMIRDGLTRRVAYGTLIRLVTMAATGFTLFRIAAWPGAWVGAAALSAGVTAEALASRVMALGTVRRLREADPRAGEPIGYRRIAGFYWPLAVTSMISLAVHPTITFFMGHARFALESLAVLPVVNSLSFIFRSFGLSYQEVAIAVLARERNSYPAVRRFAYVLAVASSLGQALVAFTPLALLWFRDVSGLTAELTRFAIPPTQLLVVMPALSVLLSFQRALLVHGRRTAPITWGAVAEVAGIVGVLAWTVQGLGMVGVTAAAVAFLAGRVVDNLLLVAPCARVVAAGRAAPSSA